MELNYRPEESMKALIHLGVKGHFPLFLDQWINEALIAEKKTLKITAQERILAKKLFQRVSKHRTLEHKKIVISSMSEMDRKLFIKAFLKLVEGKILDLKMELH